MLQISLHLLEIKLLTLQLTHSNRKVRGSVLFRLNCMVSNVWKGKEKCKSSLLEHSYWFIPDRFQKATTSNIFPFFPLLLLLYEAAHLGVLIRTFTLHQLFFKPNTMPRKHPPRRFGSNSILKHGSRKLSAQ